MIKRELEKLATEEQGLFVDHDRLEKTIAQLKQSEDAFCASSDIKGETKSLDRIASFLTFNTKEDTANPTNNKSEKLQSVADMIELTNRGNALYLIERLKNHVCFDVQGKTFRRFDGRIWRKLDSDMLYGAIEDLFAERLELALNESKVVPAVIRFYKKSLEQKSINSVIASVKGKETIRVSEMDFLENLLVTESGVLDVENKKWIKHSSDQYMTRMINAEHRKDAFENSEFASLLNTITDGNVEFQNYLQIIFAAALINLESQHIYVLYGKGSNGKSTFLEAIANVVGDYAYHIPVTELCKRSSPGSASPFWAETVGKRMLISRELDQRDHIDEAYLKELSSGVPISVRKLYWEPFTFTPQFTMFIDSNYTLQIEGSDNGIIRRVVVLPFLHEFARSEYDFKLRKRLNSPKERAAIWYWLYKGIKKVTKNPLLVNDFPEVVEKYTYNYVGVFVPAKDRVRLFAQRCLEKKKNNKIQASVLYEYFSEYCRKNDWLIPGVNIFSDEMKNYYPNKNRESAGQFYFDVIVKQEMFSKNEVETDGFDKAAVEDDDEILNRFYNNEFALSDFYD